jgi:very-short-patch-repair endonuclease
MLFYNTKLKKYSQELRKNMTGAERLLWSKLRRKQLNNFQFYRQRIIGDYIVDFYCPKSKLIVEVDGGQHYQDEGSKRDKLRDDYIRNLGMRILRVSDKEVLQNLNGVVERIYEICNPPQSPFRKGGCRAEGLEKSEAEKV